MKTLRYTIRAIIFELFDQAQKPKYFIKFNSRKKIFILYKRFYGYDEYDNKNEQVEIVKALTSNQEESQKMAKEIVGLDLMAKLPEPPKSINRGDVMMPFREYKGERLNKIPIEYLVDLILKNKWTGSIKKEPYLNTIYEYLTIEKLAQTTEFLAKKIKGTNTQELKTKFNEYLSEAASTGAEQIAFSNIMIQLLKNELSIRGMY